MCPCHSVLSIATMRLQHLMERRDSVSLLELGDTFSHLMDSASNVVALVAWRGVGHPFGDLPVFGVAARDNNLDHDLAWLGLRDGRVDDLDLWAYVDDGFFHVDALVGFDQCLSMVLESVNCGVCEVWCTYPCVREELPPTMLA